MEEISVDFNSIDEQGFVTTSRRWIEADISPGELVSLVDDAALECAAVVVEVEPKVARFLLVKDSWIDGAPVRPNVSYTTTIDDGWDAYSATPRRYTTSTSEFQVA